MSSQGEQSFSSETRKRYRENRRRSSAESANSEQVVIYSSFSFKSVSASFLPKVVLTNTMTLEKDNLPIVEKLYVSVQIQYVNY